MKKILMISYYYPPLADVGGLRALAFSRYLPEFGWEPYVLSVKNPDKQSCIPGDGQAHTGIKTYYTRSVINLSWLTGKANGLLSRILQLIGVEFRHPLVRDLICVPDEYIGWVPLTVLKGLSLIRKEKIDLIYVSCKPFSSSIIGVLLKLMTGKPLVLDFRDPFSPDNAVLVDRNYYEKVPTFRLKQWIEEKVLGHADKLLLTTKETQDQYHSCFPEIRDRTEVIYNGFFEEFFRDNLHGFQKFTIVYSGNFYSLCVPPDPFFRALRDLITADPELGSRIEFVYVGSREPWLETMIDRYDLGGIIRVTGRVSREESISYIGRASLLLLRIVPGKISTKLFEGLAAGAPLLALINRGEVAGIIEQYSLSSYFIVKPDDHTGIGRAIKNAFEKWKTGTLVKAKNRKFYEDFNKRKLTGEFSNIITDVSGRKEPATDRIPQPVTKQ